MTHVRIGRKVPPRFSLDVDFTIGPGITAMFGPAGAGKTTIIQAMAGLVRPDSGRILLGDTILFDAEARVDVPPRRRNCGYVTQQDALFPHMSLRQNVLFAARRLPRLERHRRVSEMIERFQLEAAARPLEVSEAQRLRCAVARALVAGPKMLLLDEREYDEALLREVSPLPALLVTNDLDLCCSAAQQMIVLDAGRILLRGAPRDVIDRPETLEAARLLGFSNLFEGTISALDPGRNSSRIECARFALSTPYLPGHFRGDRVWVAVRAENLRVHSGEIEGVNCVSAQLVRVSHRTRSVRLEFAGPVVAEIPPERFAPEKDNKSWSVEFPVDALRII